MKYKEINNTSHANKQYCNYSLHDAKTQFNYHMIVPGMRIKAYRLRHRIIGVATENFFNLLYNLYSVKYLVAWCKVARFYKIHNAIRHLG